MDVLLLIIDSLALGAAYALIALGFVLIINACGAVNFAHGDLVMLGGFVTVGLAVMIPIEESIWLLLPVLVIMSGVGVLIAGIAYLPLARRPPVTIFISTIAIGMIIQNGMSVWVGPQPRSAPPVFGSGMIEIADLMISRQSVAIIVVAVILIGGIHILLHGTQLGRQLRATAQDSDMARACGIPVLTMILITFALGTMLAGTAGLLLAYQFFITPTDGIHFMLKGYIAVTIGGWGSILGAMVGALLIGLFDTFIAVWLSHPIASGLLYGTLLLILGLRPQGLFGQAVGRRI